MSLRNINEHLACDGYAKNEYVIFRQLVLSENKTFKRKFLHETIIVFVVKGILELENINGDKQCISGGMMFLLPKNFDLHFRVVERVEAVLCTFTADINLCSRFSLKQLVKYIPRRKNDYILYSLSMDNRVKMFVDMLRTSIGDGILCKHYQKIKREELLIYLRVGYYKEQLAQFFYPILSQDLDFKDFVLANYKKVKDVKDFAVKANMSLSTFNRYFKASFNETAQKWLLTKKAENVMEDIIMTDMTFYEISDKYHFSSSAYFAAFCRRNFNATPNEIRKKRMKRK